MYPVDQIVLYVILSDGGHSYRVEISIKCCWWCLCEEEQSCDLMCQKFLHCLHRGNWRQSSLFLSVVLRVTVATVMAATVDSYPVASTPAWFPVSCQLCTPIGSCRPLGVRGGTTIEKTCHRENRKRQTGRMVMSHIFITSSSCSSSFSPQQTNSSTEK